MFYTLNDVFNQSIADEFSANLNAEDYEARILYGIRIEKNLKTKKVIIHNTTIGGDFYKEITSEQYEVFSKKGWRLAVFVLCLSNYRRKLDMVEHNIKREVNSRKNAKHIQNLKSARERIMCSFTKVTKKINLIIKQTNND
mgnify:CR=1 FL=1|tara:strand:- start:414 stop:836 length:423 start_codon:yes stop_codon:yes gene_type:complete